MKAETIKRRSCERQSLRTGNYVVHVKRATNRTTSLGYRLLVAELMGDPEIGRSALDEKLRDRQRIGPNVDGMM